MGKTIAVTGATGHVGRSFVERLVREGVGVRAIARRARSLISLGGVNLDVRSGDMADLSFLTDALRGVDAVFLIMPQDFSAPDFHAHQEKLRRSIIQALKGAGASRVVMLSSLGAEASAGTGQIADLHKLEEGVRTLPNVSLLVLRAAFFMENFLASVPLVRTKGVLGGTAPGGVPRPMIAVRDIAAEAAQFVLWPSFQGFPVRELLGPRDYTLRETASVLGGAIGRTDLSYAELPYEAVRKGLLESGFSASGADTLLENMKAMDAGKIRTLQGRNKSNTTRTTLETFAREVFAPAFQAAEPAVRGGKDRLTTIDRAPSLDTPKAKTPTQPPQ